MLQTNAIRKSLIWLTLFSISMGFLESSVVVYIREIAYPAGFGFPLMPMRTDLMVTEILREVATIIMLLAAGYLGGRSHGERFAWFLYCFAVWDIFYYIFLKLLIDWPQSLMTWDILFLIPVAWTGPVIAPVVISLTMIILAAIILCFSGRQRQPVRFRPFEWTLFITGSVVLIISFIWDYCSYILPFIREVGFTDKARLNQLFYQYMPVRFNWPLYITGLAFIITGIFIFYRHNRKMI